MGFKQLHIYLITAHDLRAAQALMAFSLLSALIGFILYIIWMCKKEDNGVAFGAGGACFLAGKLIQIPMLKSENYVLFCTNKSCDATDI